MLRLGNLDVTLISDGTIKIDGGVLFGDMPKSTWEQQVRVDRRNRLSLTMNCLLIQSPKHTILVDTGAGSKDVEKRREQYAIGPSKLSRNLRAAGVSPRDVDMVILTHLHFDHCGGSTRLDRWGNIIPTFPRATYLVQQANWEEATAPGERCRSAYEPMDFMPLAQAGQLACLSGDSEVVPGVWIKVTGAHSQGHQIVLVDQGSERIAFMGDLVPTHHHLDLACIPASDRFPEESLKQKRCYLTQAEQEGWLMVFGHGCEDLRAAYVERRNGHLKVRKVDL